MSAGAAARAAAARAVGAVIGPGRSLDDALAAATGALQGPDRALAAQLAYGSLRFYPRLARWTSLLLARPLPPRDADIQALLAIGLYQIEASRVPDHAAVDASVEAARLLGRARHAGLVNACLRRWLRESDALKARVVREPEVVHAHPRWWLDALARDWPRDWEMLVTANNAQAPMWVRVNHRRTSREAWLARALEAGIEAVPWDAAPDALRLEKPVAVEELPGFAQGDVSVQDGAAQLAAGLLAPQPGMRVLDACAAPGGKACHLLERYDGIALTALDVAAARLGRVRDNLARLDLEAEVLQGDAAAPAGWWDGRRYERILLDAPCTGSGVVRRHPDIKLLRRPGDTAALGARQEALLDALWDLLAPGGRLLYATCSIWRAENTSQATGFLRRHRDARAVDFGEPDWGRRAGPGRQLLSGEAGVDGFYYACLVKTS